MILKPREDHLRPENHRPISLLVIMYKLFKKTTLNRLKKHIIPRKEQNAFRTGHLTTTQLVKLIDDFALNENNKKQTKATRKKLLTVCGARACKIHQCVTTTHLTNIISSFLKNRTFSIKINSHLSTSRKISAGVSQRSCLLSLL